MHHIKQLTYMIIFC